MAEARIDAETRTEFGKGAARRTRRAGKIPAVLYGHGTDPQHLSLPQLEFARVVRDQGRNAVLTLNIGGKPHLALTKTVVTHPIRPYIEHVDLLVIRRGEKVSVEVQLVVTGDAAPGTMISQELNTLEVEADVSSIPEQIEVSVEGLEVGTQIHASDVLLPAGTELKADAGAARRQRRAVAHRGAARGRGRPRGRRRRGGAALDPGRLGVLRLGELSMAPGPALVVGLGNPGPAYADTRHNVGFGVVDLLAARAGGGRFSKHRSNADVLEGRLAGRRVVLAKPRTYMNVSGGPVTGLVRYFSVAAEDLVVVHDDLDLGFGVIRLKRGGGEGGHNGLRSISASLGTKDYLRVRFGIGRPPGRQDPADYVLKRFSGTERKELEFAIDLAADAAEALLADGLEPAQNRFHALSG